MGTVEATPKFVECEAPLPNGGCWCLGCGGACWPRAVARAVMPVLGVIVHTWELQHVRQEQMRQAPTCGIMSEEGVRQGKQLLAYMLGECVEVEDAHEPTASHTGGGASASVSKRRALVARRKAPSLR